MTLREQPHPQLGRSRWGRAALAGVTALAVTLSGCSGAGGQAGSTNGAGGSGGASGGTLVVGITSDPDTLFPWKATQFQAVNMLGLVYGTLTELTDKLEVAPGLAEKWAYSDDNKTLTLTLRKGVKFSDGSELTSADVKYSLDTIKLESTAAVASSTLASVSAVEAPDPSTVVLRLAAPDAALLAGLSTVNLAILKKGSTEASLATTVNGTGPFTVAQRKPSQSVVLTANKAYWKGAPKLDGVEFRIIPDETSVVSGMQSGAIQMATLDDPLVAKTAEGSGLTVTKTPQLSYHALQLKASAAPLDDPNLRLAIQCGIDRKQVLDTAAGGEGEVTGPITSPAYKSDPNARPCPTRDVAKAKDYLSKSKSPNGVTLKTIVSQGEYATSVNEAQSLKAQLAEVGITLDLEVLESGAFVKRWVDADFQAAVALNGGRPDPDAMYGRYFTSKGNLNKVAGYSSPALDQLFATGKSETDPAKRKGIYAEVTKTLEDDAAWVWLFTGYTYTASTAPVKGFKPLATGSLLGLRDATVK
jgi:peptide/nickel transport system substrate-binding protein